MENKIKWVLVVLGIIGIIIFGYLIYNKGNHTDVDIVQTEDIGDKEVQVLEEKEETDSKEPSDLDFFGDLKLKPDEKPKEEEPELVLNELRRDPIDISNSEDTENDKLFMEGDIEGTIEVTKWEITEEKVDTEEDENTEIEDRNEGYVEVDKEIIGIRDSKMRLVELKDIIQNQGMVIVFWSTITEGGDSTLEKWLEIYEENKEEVDFVFLNRGFGVEQPGNIGDYLEKKGIDIPVYYDETQSFAVIHDIKKSTEGFFINRDGYIMLRDDTKNLTKVELGLEKIKEHYNEYNKRGVKWGI